MLAKMEQVTDTTHPAIIFIDASTTVITNAYLCFTS
eukprot:XP_001704958.1 Hypothetical protein GL50803_7142 [Giardia lamblia ATCC 50803]